MCVVACAVAKGCGNSNVESYWVKFSLKEWYAAAYVNCAEILVREDVKANCRLFQ
jgi:hypothetical protein